MRERKPGRVDAAVQATRSVLGSRPSGPPTAVQKSFPRFLSRAGGGFGADGPLDLDGAAVLRAAQRRGGYAGECRGERSRVAVVGAAVCLPCFLQASRYFSALCRTDRGRCSVRFGAACGRRRSSRGPSRGRTPRASLQDGFTACPRGDAAAIARCSCCRQPTDG